MARYVIFLLLSLSLTSAALAQQTPSAPAGVPAGEALNRKADQLFANWDKPGSPGCTLAVIRGGQIIYKRGYGAANLDHSVPISAKSVFYIASGAKPFTAMSVAVLARQGRVSLDDEIRKYLPEMPQYQNPITIRNLIHHTSGIREYEHLMQLAGLRITDARDEEVFKTITRQKELNFEPGAEYLYSNSGYFLLAEIVRRVSGKTLAEFADENIFKPLGMMNTQFYRDNTVVIKDRATGYSPLSGGGFSMALTRVNHVGPGGLFTTIEDLFLWDQNFYRNKLAGGAQDLIEQALTPATLSGGGRLNYTFGMQIERYKGLSVISQGGSFFGYNADMIQFPEQRFSVICLCNLSSIESGRLTRQVADIYLDGQFKEGDIGGDTSPETKVVSLPEKELAEVAGSYFNSANNNFRRLYVRGGKLLYSRGSSESELAPLGNGRFLMLGVPDRIEVSFKAPRPGAALQMLTSANGSKPIIHERVESASYTPEQLAQFAGTYYSEEIDATYSVVHQDNKLVLRRKNVDESPLQLLFADTFSSVGSGTLGFTRNKQNRVSGFLVSTGRVRKLRFNKM